MTQERDQGTQRKLRVGQFTITLINNGWLVRWDVFEPKLGASIPSIQFCDKLDDVFELIKTMDPTAPGPTLTVAKSMPNQGMPGPQKARG